MREVKKKKKEKKKQHLKDCNFANVSQIKTINFAKGDRVSELEVFHVYLTK